jgi:Sec-independent protein translocase protein TatA
MGGFHPLDLVVIALVVLTIFGPKTLQSLARSAGKGANQVKDIKNKVMAELPVEEFSELPQQVPRVPMNSRQVLGMLVMTENEASETKKKDAACDE